MTTDLDKLAADTAKLCNPLNPNAAAHIADALDEARATMEHRVLELEQQLHQEQTRSGHLEADVKELLAERELSHGYFDQQEVSRQPGDMLHQRAARFAVRGCEVIERLRAELDAANAQLESINALAREYGYGQGELDDDLAGCVRKILANARAERDAAVKSMSEWATKCGLAEGKLAASEMAGVVAEWRERVAELEQQCIELQQTLEAERDWDAFARAMDAALAAMEPKP